MGFLDQLRLQNFFGPSSSIFNSPRIQPPNMYNPTESGGVNDLSTPAWQKDQLAHIGAQLQKPPQMDVVLGEQSNPGAEILRQSFARTSPEMEFNKQKLGAENQLNQQKLGQEQQKINIDKQRTDALINAEKFKQEHPEWTVKEIAGGNIVLFNPMDPTAKPVDTGIKSGTLSDTEKIRLGHQNKLEEINVSNQANKGWQVATVQDPNDPTKQINVRVNPNTNQIEPLGDPNLGTLTRPGTTAKELPITAQTRAMMEGAVMLRPHVTDLRNQAADLDRRGLFGPIMSRVRNLAAKVGTTGSPEEVQSNLENLANSISNDPLLNQNNDAAVGQFLTNLGLMTSGMGRVHGGARGGGSIQMLNYLKSILGSESSLSMFNGRLQTLDDYLKGYAAGPASNKKDKLDSALDKIFGAK